MTQVTSHILDTTKGLPATGVTVILYLQEDSTWTELGRTMTNNDGRVGSLSPHQLTGSRVLKLRFETQEYFKRTGVTSFYPFVEITFETGALDHYHIPLLLNPFGYTTYRGS